MQGSTIDRIKRGLRLGRSPIPVTAPSVMCFTENPEGMAEFIRQLKDHSDSERPVSVNVHDVVRLKLNAITVLLAAMVRFKSKKIYFNGNHPKDKIARNLLDESGFFGHLHERYRDEQSYELPGSNIYTHGKKLVDPEFSQRLINEATRTVWGESRRCRGLQRVLIELMHNTNNHASFTPGERHYWVSVHHIKPEKRVVFTFVDFGVGVFESLKAKPESSGLFGVWEKIKSLFFAPDNAKVLRLIFQGELHRTVTGQYYRGKGLPGIFAAQQKNKISKFAMITNDVFFDAETNVYQRLATDFSGTFVSWELTEHNESFKDDDDGNQNNG